MVDIEGLAEAVKRRLDREMARELHGCPAHYAKGSERIWVDYEFAGVVVHGVPGRRCIGCNRTLIAMDLAVAIEDVVGALAEAKGIAELDLQSLPGGR